MIQIFTSEHYGLPLWNWLLQAAGVVLSYFGAELNARQSVQGFRLWMVSNIVLGLLHAATGLWLLLVLDMLFLRVNILGLKKWRKKPAITC